MASSEVQIANLLYLYSEFIDSGDFDGAARLFAHARVKTPQGEAGQDALADIWKDTVMLYDGSPRCKHIVTNPIIEVDEEAGVATCRSYYTVIQQAGDAPLQPVISGRYHDAFIRVDGTWRFSARDYTLHDLPGDLSRHARNWQA